MLAEVSPTGTITSSRNYDVYGNVRSGVNANGTSAHKFVGNLGHPSDNNTGLIYMQARYMDPATGRFVSEDPGQNACNGFVYGNSNHVCKIDSNGRISNDIIDAIEECLSWAGLTISIVTRWRLRLGGINRTIAYIQTMIEQLGGLAETDMGAAALASENAEQQNEPGDSILGASDAAESEFCGTQAAYRVNAIAELEGLQLLLEMAEDAGFTGQ